MAKAKPGPKPLLQPDEKTLAQIRALGAIQCTDVEVASVLKVCRATLTNFFAKHPEAKQAWKDGQDEGKASLRRKQFTMAERNAAMAIWLGKQYLGQKDRHELSGDADSPVHVKTGVEITIVDPEG